MGLPSLSDVWKMLVGFSVQTLPFKHVLCKRLTWRIKGVTARLRLASWRVACFQGDGEEPKVIQTVAGTDKQTRGKESKVSHFWVLVSLLWNIDPLQNHRPGCFWEQSVSDQFHLHWWPGPLPPLGSKPPSSPQRLLQDSPASSPQCS